MYSNIGGKIKVLAWIIAVLGIIGSFVSGLGVAFMCIEELEYTAEGMLAGALSGILTLAVGTVISWVGTFILYGFGQLIDNSDKQVALLEAINNKGQ